MKLKPLIFCVVAIAAWEALLKAPHISGYFNSVIWLCMNCIVAICILIGLAILVYYAFRALHEKLVCQKRRKVGDKLD
jgi:hypothetical protein